MKIHEHILTIGNRRRSSWYVLPANCNIQDEDWHYEYIAQFRTENDAKRFITNEVIISCLIEDIEHAIVLSKPPENLNLHRYRHELKRTLWK
jgi:hypothetical protein